MNIIEIGGEYFFFNDAKIINRLEVGNYILMKNVRANTFSLKPTEDFKFPDPLYMVEDKICALVKKSFESNENNLGVLLSGLKGSGKSVTAKLIAKQSNVPVIIIKDKIPISMDLFGFLSGITTPVCLLIDEFEKIFEDSSNEKEYHTQNSFLSYMDGALSSSNKTLFIFTTNYHVNKLFINRPSRIKFYKDYGIIDEKLIDMIVSNELKNKNYEKDLRENIDSNFNLDLLMTIIRDINMLDEPFSSFKEVYNYRPQLYRYTVYIEVFPHEKVLNYNEESNDDNDDELFLQKQEKLMEKDGKRWIVSTKDVTEKYDHSSSYVNGYRVVACLKTEMFSSKFVSQDGREIITAFQDKV